MSEYFDAADIALAVEDAEDTDKAAELGWHLQAQIKAAVLAEREECAKVCEELNEQDNGFPMSALVCATAIRARREK